ncbi:MAG: YceI family protein [Desulfovibrio sp.]
MNDCKFFTIDDVAEALDSPATLVLDVLYDKHFQRRHIAGAKSACVYEMVFLETVEEFAKELDGLDTTILLYGAGPDSREAHFAAQKLSRVGYTDVCVYSGGLAEWTEMGQPLEGSDVGCIDPDQPLFFPEQQVYKIDPEKSVIRWTGRNMNGGHYGTVGVKSGQLDFSSSMVGCVRVDMTSINNIDLDADMKPVLEAHLASDDFFFTSLFPEAILNIKSSEPVAPYWATSPNYHLDADLVMRGMTHPLAFSAYVSNVKGGIALQAQVELDRTCWDVLYGSSRFFKHLGFHVVFDVVSLDIYFRLE